MFVLIFVLFPELSNVLEGMFDWSFVVGGAGRWEK